MSYYNALNINYNPSNEMESFHKSLIKIRYGFEKLKLQLKILINSVEVLFLNQLERFPLPPKIFF